MCQEGEILELEQRRPSHGRRRVAHTLLGHGMKYKGRGRTDAERRDEDKGPPAGWSERRRTVERRKPEVTEISFAEWIAYMRQKSHEHN